MGQEKVVTGDLSIEEMTAKVMAYWISASERLLDGRPDHKIRDMQN